MIDAVAYLDVAHCSKIVNFSGLNLGNDGNEVCRVAKIAIVQEHFDPGIMTISVDVINTPRVKGG